MNPQRIAIVMAADRVTDPPHVVHGVASCLRCRCNLFAARLRVYPGAAGILHWDGSDHEWRVIEREINAWWPVATHGRLVFFRATGHGGRHRCGDPVFYAQPPEGGA